MLYTNFHKRFLFCQHKLAAAIALMKITRASGGGGGGGMEKADDKSNTVRKKNKIKKTPQKILR
jgi:hypothetical protein